MLGSSECRYSRGFQLPKAFRAQQWQWTARSIASYAFVLPLLQKYTVRPSIWLLRHRGDNLDRRPDFSCYHVTDLRTRGVKRTGGSWILRFSGTAVAVDGTQHRFLRICFATVAVDALSEAVKGISNIEASIQLLSDKYDEILEKTDSQGTEIAALRKRVERLESETSPNTQEVKAQLNELEQYSRRQNIEIHGMQKEENENLLDKMNCLARTLELPELSDSDLHSLHRLHPRAGKMPVEELIVSWFITRVGSSRRAEEEVACLLWLGLSPAPYVVPFYVEGTTAMTGRNTRAPRPREDPR
ncbi:hypothetical protein HPB49_000398 [Dermacentor silvarum]|uniref:Uncharacterized protein n=1 Tax=Dermacentor silvarum TaxID=543639 RepID=A0ACB8CNE3_DERSI|nr:hypothetical protein HPB49_000398 [Dermacentor silvarum]